MEENGSQSRNAPMRIRAAKPEIKILSGIKNLEIKAFGWIFPMVLNSPIPNQSRINFWIARWVQRLGIVDVIQNGTDGSRKKGYRVKKDFLQKAALKTILDTSGRKQRGPLRLGRRNIPYSRWTAFAFPPRRCSAL